MLPYLQSTKSVYALPLDGHRGGRPLPAGVELTTGVFVDGVERDLDALGLERPHLLGNSLGGWIALQLAARGVPVLSCAWRRPGDGWPTELFELSLASQFLFGYGLCRGVLKFAPDSLDNASVRAALLTRIVHKPEQLDAAAAHEIVENIAGCAVMLPAISRRRRRAFGDVGPIDCPVRIAWSGNDRVLRGRWARARFDSLVPQAEQLILPGVGHIPMSDDPPLVARAMSSLWSTVRQRSAASVDATPPGTIAAVMTRHMLTVARVPAELGQVGHGWRRTVICERSCRTSSNWSGVLSRSPLMRGTNETTNGLVRQYLRKGTHLRVHTAADLAVVEHRLNTRPC